MKILVTGGRGFVGGYLVDSLRNKGYEVYITSSNRNSCVEEDFIYWDLSALDFRIPSLPKIDCVVHLAADVHCRTTVQQQMNVNVLGTARVFKAAKSIGARKFIVMSSMSVYGFADYEKDLGLNDCYRPKTPYALSKALSDCLLDLESEDPSISSYILRCPVVYGVGDPGNFLRLYKMVQKLGFMIDFGLDGTRSILHVRNLSDAICHVIERKVDPGKYFLEDSLQYSVKRYVEEISKANSRNYKLVTLPKIIYNLLKAALGDVMGKIWGSLTVSSVGKLPDFGPKYTMFDYFEELCSKKHE